MKASGCFHHVVTEITTFIGLMMAHFMMLKDDNDDDIGICIMKIARVVEIIIFTALTLSM